MAKGQSGGFPSLPAIAGLHQTYGVGAAEIAVTRRRQDAVGKVGVQGNV